VIAKIKARLMRLQCKRPTCRRQSLPTSPRRLEQGFMD
jgi:hypothetical protein